MTFSDPAIYEKPWTSKVTGAYTADTDLLKYVWAENEKDRAHSIGKKSDDTKHAVKLPPEVLSQYAGPYNLRAKELTGVDLLPLRVVPEDGELGVADAPWNLPASAAISTSERTTKERLRIWLYPAPKATFAPSERNRRALRHPPRSSPPAHAGPRLDSGCNFLVKIDSSMSA